jgi:hypothetical protein
LSALLLLPLAACTQGDRRFTSESWRATDPLQRSVFVDDLVARRVLVGKQQRDVYAMLGAPDYRGAEFSTWTVGTRADGGQVLILQVDFREGTAIKATQRTDQ